MRIVSCWRAVHLKGLPCLKMAISMSSIVSMTVICFRTCWEQQFEQNTEEWSQMVLLHNNACLHNAIWTADTLQKLNFVVSKYRLYSPQLLPLDYCGFGSIQRHLKSILHQWSTFARSRACIAGQPIKNPFLFWRHTETCSTMDYAHWK